MTITQRNPPPPASETARPALINDVMTALHYHSLSGAVEISQVERALTPCDLGVRDALLGAREHGWVEMIGGGPDPNTARAVCLTQSGRRDWLLPDGTEGKDAWEPVPLRYVYRVSGELTLGTLADWASAWEHQQYAGEPELSSTLLTWGNRQPGFHVHVDRLTTVDDAEQNGQWITYRVWAAGEAAFVTLDGLS